MADDPQSPESANRKAAVMMFMTVTVAIMGICYCRHTPWFIPVSILLPIGSAALTCAISIHYRASKLQKMLMTFLGLAAPAVCSGICWIKLIRHFIT